MKILHISDTHGQHGKLTSLPEADVIVHSGDFTFGGSDEEAEDFVNWFCKLPYRHKVFIAGNHDMCMYGKKKIKGLPKHVHYLCNSGVEIDGVKFFGIPLFMEDVMMEKLDSMYSGIPIDTNILVTHQPPSGYCDISNNIHYGSKVLWQRIEQIKDLKFHLFGHQHEANNEVVQNGTVFSNAAVLDNQYNIIAKPHLLEL